jgi:hypothetical protein
VSTSKTVASRVGQVAASLIVLAHVGVLGATVAAVFMIVATFAYCWTISSEDRAGRAIEIIRAFQRLPRNSSKVVQQDRKSASVLAMGARDDRRKRREAIRSREPGGAPPRRR